MQTTRSPHRAPGRPHYTVRKQMQGGRRRTCTCIDMAGLARDLPMNLWIEVQRSHHQCAVHGRGMGSVRLGRVHPQQRETHAPPHGPGGSTETPQSMERVSSTVRVS